MAITYVKLRRICLSYSFGRPSKKRNSQQRTTFCVEGSILCWFWYFYYSWWCPLVFYADGNTSSSRPSLHTPSYDSEVRSSAPQRTNSTPIKSSEWSLLFMCFCSDTCWCIILAKFWCIHWHVLTWIWATCLARYQQTVITGREMGAGRSLSH